MNTQTPIRILAALAALALSACQSTMVESLPTGTVSDCPAEWRGAWLALDGDSGADEDAGFVVTGACEVTMVEEHEGKPRELKFTPRFATARGTPIALFGHEEAAHMFEGKPPPKAGWYPFEWRRHDDVLVLRAPDHRRIATLIVNGALEGSATWSGNEGFNFVSGDAAAVTTALTDGRVSFGGEGGARARRVGDSRRDLDRAIERVARDKRREEQRAKRSGGAP